ncbi:MAG: heavy-metal-associated domain-containing protein [Flavobacteriales bacterium]|nr:heavy-metal-associated domain-containing protein [Flavobacteriales bacterium]MCB9193078.1 heavy-metal-associated domain-containing protein [Flavobacteriales bacterium]
MNTLRIAIVTFSLMAFGVTKAQNDHSKDDKYAHLEVHTSAICGTCKKTIEGDLIYEKGVHAVHLDLAANVIHVSYDADRTDPDKIRKAITRIGYDADGLVADPKAMKRLPACCQKEAEEHLEHH